MAVSRYRLVTGLGAFYLLSLEVRTRIWAAYFSDRTVAIVEGQMELRY